MQIDRPIAIALILFATLLLVFFLLVPGYNTFGKLQTQLGEKKAEFNAEYDYYAAISKTYFDLQSHQSDTSKIDDALPSNSDLGKLVYFFQSAAKDNGMMLKDLFLSKSTPSGASSGIKDIVFSMDLVGDYTSLENFIVSLEKSARILEVTNISFGAGSAPVLSSSQSQFQIQQIYNFNIQVRTHSY